MSIPLLPSLKEDNKTAIPQPGQWTSGTQNSLSNLVDGLKVAAGNDSRISSIPDVWARPVLFKSILFDANHPLHQKYVNEWRGLLAIMAFHKQRDYDLHLEGIEIPEVNKLDNEMPAFLKVLAKSLPDDYKNNEDDSTVKPGIVAKIQIVTYGEDPLAFMWPTMFLCPAVELDTADRRRREVPWWKVDGLNDPIADLSDEEKNMFHKWLGNLCEHVDEKDTKLIDILKDFQKDIKDSLKERFVAGTTIPVDTGKSQGLGITGVSAIIDNPLIPQITDDFLDNSQVLLESSPERNTKEKKILVVAKNLEEQWNCNINEIKLAGSYTVGSVLSKWMGVMSKDNRIGDVDLEGFNAEIREADDFLTDHLAVINLGMNVFPNAMKKNNVNNFYVQSYRGNKVNIILPIKSELLTYLEPKYIIEHTTVKVVDDAIEVCVELPVSGSANNRTIIAKRRYSEDDKSFNKIIKYNTVPVLQVWPNFIFGDTNRWKAYYSFYDAYDNNTFYAKPIWEEVNARVLTRELVNAEISRGERFPEAYGCFEKKRDNESERLYSDLIPRGQEEMEVGIILLNMPKKTTPQRRNEEYNIGIDFGTTNSVAYILRGTSGSKNAELLALRDRMYPVCYNDASGDEGEIGLDEVAKSSLRNSFFSTEEQLDGGERTSIRTMFNAYSRESIDDRKMPLFKGNIYYLDSCENLDRDSLDNIDTVGLKWGGDNQKENREGFLNQLAMQCLAEAVYDGADRVNWAYSYPQSFTKREQKNYMSTWQDTIRKMLGDCTDVEQNMDGGSKTESLCIADYFIDAMEARTNSGMVCLDIGGGSTDIVVWQGANKKVKYQTSLLIAGNMIINEYLYNKMERDHLPLLQLIGTNPALDEQLDALKYIHDKDKFGTRVEAILRYHEEQVFDSLNRNAEVEIVNTMIRDIAFVLSGMFFYVGMIIGALRRNGDIKANALPKCYLGGNGSKLLHWAAEGHFTSDSFINDVFEACFKTGVAYTDPEGDMGRGLRFELTELPKQEVAYGLVSSRGKDGNRIDTSEMREGCIAGERFFVDGEEVKSDYITAEDLLNTVEVSSERPSVFMQFVDVFNKEIKELEYDPIDLEDDYYDICDAVNDQLARLTEDAEDDVDRVKLEPLFILILKQAFKEISKQ